MLKDIVVSAVLPYLAYLVLTAYGVDTVTALVAGSLFPVVSIIVAAWREKRLQVIGVITLAANFASVIGSLYFQSPAMALAKGSLITGVIGLVFGASLLAPRPLVFYLASAAPEEREHAETRWQTLPAYRRIMRLITFVWFAGLVLEAGLRLLLIPVLPITVFLPVSEVMWLGCFTLLTAWSYRYGRRMTARAQSQASMPSGANEISPSNAV